MRRSLRSSRVLVTGASSGIGQALAEQLATAGAELLVTARREERLRQLVERLRASGTKADYVAGDIEDVAARARLVEWVKDRWGALDALVNCAGLGAVGPFEDASAERLRRVMEVNFFAPAELTRACLPWLERGRQPVVVNIGSVLGHVAVPDKSEYCASKFALRAWSESLGFELRGRVDVLLVSPSTTASEFFSSVVESPAKFRMAARPMAADAVARQVVRAMTGGRRELIVSLGGRSLVWAHRWFPGLVRPFVQRVRLVENRRWLW